jgi:hypothetical protein
MFGPDAKQRRVAFEESGEWLEALSNVKEKQGSEQVGGADGNDDPKQGGPVLTPPGARPSKSWPKRDGNKKETGMELTYNQRVPIRFSRKREEKVPKSVSHGTPLPHHEDAARTCANYTSSFDFVERGFEEFIIINKIELDGHCGGGYPSDPGLVEQVPPASDFRVTRAGFYKTPTHFQTKKNPSAGPVSNPVVVNANKMTRHKGEYSWVRNSWKREWLKKAADAQQLVLTWPFVDPPQISEYSFVSQSKNYNPPDNM